MGTNTTIDLNGKRYDARTGKIISDQPPEKTAASAVKPSSGIVMDGFVRKPPAPKSANHASRQLEKSNTLMRPAVKKPAPAKAATQQANKAITPPAAVDHARLSRAGRHEKSPHISRFHRINPLSKKEAHLPVVSPSQTVAGALHAGETRAQNELKKFEEALQGANSHLQQLEKGVVKKAHLLDRIGFRNRAANLATMSLATVLLVGFFAYQNAPAIEMRAAAARSGVSAKMPGYKPSGYGVAGAVKSEPGKVSVSFKSRTDNKHFKVVQQSSNWSSTSLLANHVSRTNQPYQTYQNDGKTVYIFNNSNATWVNGGVWYQVEGDASLTSDQLLRLANSL